MSLERTSAMPKEGQVHRQQVAKRGPNPRVDNRATSPEVFGPLNERFGFTLDVCATPNNAKCARYFTPEQNGLEQSWANERVWCNPPYSDVRPWVNKAWEECGCSQIVMLVPANRTEQVWWQEQVEPFRDRPWSPLKVEFLRGRLRFIDHDKEAVEPNQRPPFGCCLLIWGKS